MLDEWRFLFCLFDVINIKVVYYFEYFLLIDLFFEYYDKGFK